jgi:dTDP-4-dehydrorhamnose 3,5-epimerase
VIFTPVSLAGAWLVALEPHEDERGFFARVWCAREFADHGLDARLVQASMSLTLRRGTLRGMHWQAAPHEEVKLVRCVRGAIHDVILDLRPGSPTYLQHVSAELTAANRLALYIPRGFAHGFQTLEDDTEVFYQMSDFYEPAAARGARWNDPAFGIAWPVTAPILHPRDAGYPDFVPEAAR